MFLIVARESELGNLSQGCDRRDTRIGGASVSVVCQGQGSALAMTDDGMELTEGPPIGLSTDLSIALRIQVSHSRRRIRVERATTGTLPAYYTIADRLFICASHIRWLAAAGVHVEQDDTATPELFVYRTVMPPKTLYKNINELCCGESLEIEINDGRVQMIDHKRYSIPEPDDDIGSIDELAEAIKLSLQVRLEALKPFADDLILLLSGGIDSSILCAVARLELDIRETYSAGYPFEAPSLNDEKHYAQTAAEHFHTNHTYHQPDTERYLTGLVEAIWHAELPVSHLQSVCFNTLFADTSGTVVVNGVGAGGAFGNFLGAFLYGLESPLNRVLSRPVGRMLVAGTARVLGRGRHFLSNLQDIANSERPLDDPDNPIWKQHAYGSSDWVCTFFGVDRRDIIKSRYERLSKLGLRTIYDLWAIDSLIGDEQETLTIWGKIANGHGKYLYTPFYEKDVLDLVLRAPWSLITEKPGNALRKTLARHCGVPEWIIRRPKRGFGIRSSSWYRPDGPLQPLVWMAEEEFGQEEIRRLQQGDLAQGMTVWNMINYAIWRRLFVDRTSVKDIIKTIRWTANAV